MRDLADPLPTPADPRAGHSEEQPMLRPWSPPLEVDGIAFAGAPKLGEGFAGGASGRASDFATPPLCWI